MNRYFQIIEFYSSLYVKKAFELDEIKCINEFKRLYQWLRRVLLEGHFSRPACVFAVYMASAAVGEDFLSFAVVSLHGGLGMQTWSTLRSVLQESQNVFCIS